MDFVKLGRTGVDVSRLCLGCMTYGESGKGSHPWTLSEEDSRPFILTALAVDKFFAASARIRRHYRMIEYVAGGLLILIGVLIFTNKFTVLAKAIDRWLPWLTRLT